MIRRFIVVAVVLCAAWARAGALYVAIDDPRAGDEPCEGRGTEAHPYRSISAAARDAAEGSTIYVKPGVYSNDTPHYVSQKYGSAQLCVDKRLRIESTGGKDVTVLEGRFSDAWREGRSAATRWGAGASRCVFVAAEAEGTVICGFTLRNGGTHCATDSAPGGGVCALANAYVVDSVISNCCSQVSGAAMEGGTAIRCLIAYNFNASWPGGMVQDAKLWNCVLRETATTASYSYRGVTAVNCTFLSDGFRAGGSALYNSLVEYNGYVESAEAVGGTNVYDHTVFVSSLQPHRWNPQTLAPMFLDVRLLPYSSALNAGATANMRGAVAIPDEFADSDYYGQAIDYSSATCHAGASQGTAEPAGGALQVGTGWAMTVDGGDGANGMYAFPTSWPTVYRFRSRNGTPCYASAYVSSNDVITTCQPGTDGAYRLLPPAETNRYAWVWFVDAADVLWADASADPSVADGSEAHPYPTIQQAADACVAARQSESYSVVFVRPGDYAVGGLTETGRATRVCFRGKSWSRLSVRSTGGAAVTTIRGGPGTGGVWSDGAQGSGMSISGFTVADCSRTAEDSVGVAASGVGLFDCVVTNCSGKCLLQSSSLERCRVVGNTVSSALLRGGGAYFSAFHGNVAGKVTHGDGETLGFCSVAGNAVSGTMVGHPTYCLQCAIDANWAEFATRSTDEDTILWNFTYWDRPSNYWYADPCFVNVASGDLRMTSASPGYATARLRPSESSVLFLHMSADFDGVPITDWPALSSGCHQTRFPTAFRINDPYRSVTIEGATRWGNVVECGESRTFTMRPAPNVAKKATAYVVTTADGTVTTNRISDLPGGALTLTVTTPETSVTLDVLSARDWYVDATNGNDTNDGLSAALAKRTFGALYGQLQPGDTVRVLPGTYDEGRVMEPGSGDSIYSRLVIPEGVAFVSTGGREVTVIRGAAAEEPGPEARDAAPFAKYGVGLRATRCVYMNRNSRLEGFTLTGGRTYVRWIANAVAGHRLCGAGVMAVDKTARVVNCDFTDCVGVNGAAAHSGTLVNCRVTGCGGLVNGSDASHLFYGGPTLVNVLAYATPEYTTYSGAGEIYNSTLIGAPHYTTVNSGEGQVKCYNSLIYGNCASANLYFNCVLATNSVYEAWSGSAPFNPSCAVNCRFPAVGDVPVDDKYRPKGLGASLLVDAGDNALLFEQDDDAKLDVQGGPRVWVGIVDIGAYELGPDEPGAAASTAFFVSGEPVRQDIHDGRIVAARGYALPKALEFVPVMGRMLYSTFGIGTGVAGLRKAQPELAVFDHPWMETQFTLRQNDIQSWTDPTPPTGAWTNFPTRISEVMAAKANEACAQNILKFERDFPGHPFTLVAHGARPVSILKRHFDTDFTDFAFWRDQHPSFHSFCAFDEYDSVDWAMNAVTDPDLASRRDEQYLPMSDYRFPCQRADVDYEKIKSFYFGTDELYGLWSVSLAVGHNLGRKNLKFLFYEAEHGSTASPWRWGGLFARGAARQFHTAFGWYSAMFTNNTRCRDGSSAEGKHGVVLERDGFITWPNPASTNRVPHLGSSRSLLRRNVRYGYFIGGIRPTVEGSTSSLFAIASDGESWALSPYGEDYNAVFEWDRRHDRGTVYTPVAFLTSVGENLNRQCCNTLPAKDEGSLPAFLFTLLPSYVTDRALYCDPKAGFEGCMWNSEFGEIADILCPDAGPTDEKFAGVLRAYKAAFLIGYHDPKTCPSGVLEDYVRQGGTLLCSYDQVADGLVGAEAAGVSFGEETVRCGARLLDEHGATVETFDASSTNTLHVATASGAVPLLTDEHGAVVAWMHAYGLGRVVTVTVRRMTSDDFLRLREDGWRVYQWWSSSVYARLASGELKMPIIHYLLKRVQDETMPIAVEGDIQWGLNKTAKGWMLWLINNRGVTKFAFEPEDIDLTKTATVTVNLKDLAGLKPSDITDPVKTVPLAVKDGSFTVSVKPGEDVRIAIE